MEIQGYNLPDDLFYEENHFGVTLEKAAKRRRKLEREWGGRLEESIKTCWVAYKEYYA